MRQEGHLRHVYELCFRSILVSFSTSCFSPTFTVKDITGPACRTGAFCAY